MKRKFTLAALLFLSTGAFAQEEAQLIKDSTSSFLQQEVAVIQNSIKELNKEIQDLKKDQKDIQEKQLNSIENIQNLKEQKTLVQNLKNKVDSQGDKINISTKKVEGINNKIGTLEKSNDSIFITNKGLKVQLKSTNEKLKSETDALTQQISSSQVSTNKKLEETNATLSQNRIYWMLASLATLVLGLLMYIFLGKKIKSSKTDVEAQIRNTKQALEEEGVKLDSKLIDVLETKIKLSEAAPKTTVKATNGSAKEDHSLALKVADEIVRMQKNISKMDESIKGLKPLLKGIERIQNNFASNGYEMINYMNKPYDDRMNIDVINFIEDENLAEGAKVIAKIVKPQVNFKDKMIQRAQVEVAQN